MEKDKNDEVSTSKEINNEHEGNNSNSSEQPVRKKSKLNEENDINNIAINNRLSYESTKQILQNCWTNENAHYSSDSKEIELYSNPFQHCLLQNFIENPIVINEIINEMITNIDWSRKQMDLYEFYQSIDLSGIPSSCKYLTGFFELLKIKILPWLEEITGIKLNKVSASCSMYNCGDHLLVHDDLLSDREIAFVYYLSPWKNVEIWNENMGGCLEIFNSDSNCFPQFPVMKKIPPRNNQFLFFKVGKRSFHQVGEVTTFDYPRLTINGWFHGKLYNDILPSISLKSLLPSLQFDRPIEINTNLENYISEIYLNEEIKRTIQKHVEDNSEISLQDFFRDEKYDEILNELKLHEDKKWKIKGPANIQNYEILEMNETNEVIREFIEIFKSEKIFKLLYEYTDLDLYGNNAKNPKCNVEVQRWYHGSYTILGVGDNSTCDENTLEIIYYLNATDDVGVITYLNTDNSSRSEKYHSDDDESSTDDENDSESDDSVLLTITPKNNNLSIVYRSKGTSKFTKYVSKNCKIPNGHVYIIVASYRE